MGLEWKWRSGQQFSEPWPIPKIAENIKYGLPSFLNNPSPSTCDQKCGLLVYSQMIRDFGWKCQHQVFTSYQEDEMSGNNLPVSDADKINQWVIRFSQTVNYNLVPLFGDFWKWPLTTSTKNTLSSLTPYLPDDVITQKPEAQSLVQKILAKYPNIKRSVSSLPDCPRFRLEYMN